MKNDICKNIKEFIQLVLKLVESKLDNESIDYVNHYINHDEYEMAFEGLFLEIMKFEKIPEIDFLKSKEIGELLKLDEESVFDFDFWNKFKYYLETTSSTNSK
jgi:hypothetical protein